MFAPGSVFSSGRVDITASAGNVPSFLNQGVGFEADGSLCVDTDAPSGDNYKAGIRLSSAGAVYGTTSTAGSDVWVEGIRVSALGQLIYEAAAATAFQNGNPQTSNGRFASA